MDERRPRPTRRRSVWTFGALIAASVGGCDRAPGPLPACSFEGTVAEPEDAGPANPSAEANAEEQGLAFLAGFLGPYVRGEASVYRGTLTAHDNQGVLGSAPANGNPGYEDQSIPEGAAVATLSVTSTDATLTLHSLTQHEYMVLEQEGSLPGVTSIGIILGDTLIGGNSGQCSGCVPAFRDKPQTIDFAGASATSVVNLDVGGDNQNVTLRTYAAANLELTPPCSISFEDIAELNGASGVAFVPMGSEWVAEWSGIATGDSYYCSFQIELYVSVSNVAEYGVRNVEFPDGGCSSF
jgi:hypothetical protein